MHGAAQSDRAPGPTGSLIMGSLGAFKADSIGFLERALQDHGDVVRMRFGPVTAHLVNHPDYIEQVLSRSAANFDKKTRSVAQIRATCGDSLLSANAAAWQRHRRLIQPVFQPKVFADIGPVVDAEMADMMTRWQGVADQGGTVDIVAEMMHLVIATSVRMLFSSDVDIARLEAALTVILADTWRRIQSPRGPTLLFPGLHRRAFRGALAVIDDIVLGIIKDRKARSEQVDDLLGRLLTAHEAEGDERLSDQELRDIAVTLLLAGHETTASALAWTFHLVAQAPDAGFETLDPKLLFAETIRLYPSIWILERRVLEATTIDGYTVKRGTSVLISPYLMHRHPDYWPNPMLFDPCRFEGDHPDRPRHAYIPFGLGPHRCVGLHMANAVAARVIENVYARFRLRTDTVAADVDPGITLRHAGNLWMKVETV